ncbi:unnamed protein product [Cunninghamella blakesleeana]
MQSSLNYSDAKPSTNTTATYSQEQQQQPITNNQSNASSPATAVKPDSPIKSYSNISISQPTTPRPNGSPIQQTHTSITQPPSPQDNNVKLEAPVQPLPTNNPPPTYIITSNNGNSNDENALRRKRRESDYTSDTPTFGATKYLGNVYSTDKTTILDVRIQSKVDRGFFLADNDWTCYRRNYFQISSSFSLQNVVVLYDGQELPCLVHDQDMLHDVQQFYLGISAKLSDCEKPIALIQHTAKRDKGPQSTPEPKPIRPGGNLHFSAVGANQSIVTFERIQFKSATANNGKRRAAQQYYVLRMELYAKIRASGKLVLVATNESQALVVRGRSPGHYAESHGSSENHSSNNANNVNGAGGPMRRHHSLNNNNNNSSNHIQHPSSHPHPNAALTSPPMIPGHPHTSTSSYPAQHHPLPPPPHPHPSTMYGSEYPTNYDYPTSAHGNTGIHYAYAPPHAGVPLVPGGSHPPSNSSNGSYDYHHRPHPPPPHPSYHPSAPPMQRPDHHHSNVYEHSYPPPHPQQHHYLPPPMHRSESAPSTYDHFKEEDQQQHQHQHQQWARVRMASTPGHHHHHPHHPSNQPSPTTEHNVSPYVAHPNTSAPNSQQQQQPNDQHPNASTSAPPPHPPPSHSHPPPQPHPYYSQHPSHHHPQHSQPVSYYHHASQQQQSVYNQQHQQQHPENPTTPVDVAGYHHNYQNNWQWRQQNTVPSHHVDNYQQKDSMVKIEPKAQK